MKNQSGFTLIEMLIVLFIITILILITVPNITKHMETIEEKGCEGYKTLVQAQVESYRMEKLTIPTIKQLEDEGYLKKDAKGCSKKTINILPDGKVELVGAQ